jgi:hypothetical protein
LGRSDDVGNVGHLIRFGGDQWTFWPLGTDLEQRLRRILRFSGWTGTLGSSSSEYGEFGNRYETIQAQIVTAWLPGI